MEAFGQSLLLHALGWATLNSFWQVGLLWCGYALACRYGSFSADKQFRLAVSGIGLGLLCFGLSLLFYLQPQTRQALFPQFAFNNSSWMPVLLTAASVTYLLLLVVPAARLVHNWRFLRRLRREGLHKAPVQYRLFVRNIAGHLYLRRPVQVFLSSLVSSPVTIGYIKPLILLPVASFNQLSLAQAEAVLLHELAHIRRADFLLNIAITLAQTLLYFNPFVRLFVQAAEASRERSCDNLVLQFDYDRVAYASALLQLEKTSRVQPVLAMGAAGKASLLSRVQAILGVGTTRPILKMQHFTGLLASVLCIFVLHSFFLTGKYGTEGEVFGAVTRLTNPFQLAFSEHEAPVKAGNTPAQVWGKKIENAHTVVVTEIAATDEPGFVEAPPAPPLPEPQFIQVAQKEAATSLSAEEQKQVEEVISTTKKVLTAYEWQQMEQSMADGFTEAEKEKARQQYEAEVYSLDWERMEENLAQNYHQTDLDRIQHYLNNAADQIKRDSLVKVYNSMLHHLTNTQKTNLVPLPDISTCETENLKVEIRKVRDSLITEKKRPIIKL